jgi:release factor glutamine methyltransferase
MTYANLLDSAVRRLRDGHGDEARLDAELLLAAARGQTRAWLLAQRDEPVDEAAARRFAGFVERRAQHEPVAYILGHKEFYGLDLLVDRRVLIPRPESETLVEQALEWIRQHFTVTPSRSLENRGRKRELPSPPAVSLKGRGRWRASSCVVVDVGTGSGALALALAAHTPREAVRLIAADVSLDALAVAQANAARHGLAERIQFVQSDLLAGIDPRADLIVANLPYVARAEWGELAPDISAYEPRLALDGGPDGLDLFRTFFAQAATHLAPGGALLLEIGSKQANAVRALAQAAFPTAQIDIVKDLAGQDRVVRIESQGVRCLP